MPSRNDILWNFTGDTTSLDRAAARAEQTQRRYDLAIRRARAEMDADLARSAARQQEIREQAEASLQRQAEAERQHALTVIRARREMDADLARSAQAERDAAVQQIRARREMDADLARSAAEQQATRDAALEQQQAAQEASIESMESAAEKLAVFGAAGLAGLGLAAQQAMMWETAWAGVTKTVDASDDTLAQLEDDLRDLALVLPSTHEEIAAVAAAAGALGVAAPDVVQFTKTMLDLGVATDDLTAEEAATSIAQMMNVMQSAPEDVDNLASTLVELGNSGASTEGQILAMAQRIAGAGATIGMSEADVLGYAAALSDVGIEAEAGGSAISKVFVDMASAVADGGDELETFASVAGMSAESFATAFEQDPARAMQAFIEGLGEVNSSGGDVFATLESLGMSEIRVRDAMLRLANATGGVGESLDNANGEWKENNALAEEAAKRYETTEAKVQMARNAFTGASIDIGENLLPVLASLAEVTASVSGAFSSLPEPVQTFLVSAAGIVTVSALVAAGLLKVNAMLVAQTATMRGVITLMIAQRVALAALYSGAVLAGLGAMAWGLSKVWDQMERAKGDLMDTNTIHQDLIKLGLAGEKAGGFLDRFGESMTDLGPTMRDAARGFDLSIGSFGKESTRKDIENLDKALVQLVESGDELDFKAAAADFEIFKQEGLAAGLTIEEITELFSGYDDALDRHAATAEVAGIKTKALAEETEDAKDAAEDLTPEQEKLARQFGLTGDEAKGLAEELDAMNQELDELFEKLYGQQIAADKVAQGWLDLKEGVQETRDAYREAVDAVNNATTEEARADAQKTLDKLYQFTGTLDGMSQEALNNREAVLGQLQAYIGDGGLVDALDETRMTSGEYQDAVEALKEEFIRNATEAGYARDGVEEYARSFDLVPTDLPTQIKQPGMDKAIADTTTLGGLVEGVDNTYHSVIELEAQKALTDARAMQDYLEWMNGYVANALINVDVVINGRVVGDPGNGGTRPGPQEGNGQQSGGAQGAGGPLGAGPPLGTEGPQGMELPSVPQGWGGFTPQMQGALAGTRSLPAGPPGGNYGAMGSGAPGGARSSTVNLTINQPVNSPTSETIGAANDMIRALAG